MRKIIRNPFTTFVAMVLAFIFPHNASATEWSVNPADFRYDMSLYFELSFSSTDVQTDLSNYEVASFVDNDCRGVSEIMPDVDNCMYMRIRSNSKSGDILKFKLLDKSSGSITEIEEATLTFEHGKVVGLPSSPYKLEVINYYNVEISSTEGGSTDITSGRYAEGSEITVTATPDDRFRFVKWSDGITEAKRTLKVSNDIKLEAIFEKYLFSITYVLDGNIFKQVDVEVGAKIIAEEAPAIEGYEFVRWEGLPETMPAEDLTVTAVYKTALYSLTVYLDNEIYLDTRLAMGDPIEIPTPQMPPGRMFDGWEEEVPEKMPSHDLVIHGTTSPTSVLQPIFYDENVHVTVYDIHGNLMLKDVTKQEASDRLPHGIYIINGVKIYLKRI